MLKFKLGAHALVEICCIDNGNLILKTTVFIAVRTEQ